MRAEIECETIIPIQYVFKVGIILKWAFFSEFGLEGQISTISKYFLNFFPNSEREILDLLDNYYLNLTGSNNSIKNAR